jgi:hypothetical protein
MPGDVRRYEPFRHTGVLARLPATSKRNPGTCRQELCDSETRSASPIASLEKVGVYWSARVGLHYRVLAKERAEGLVWFWIGHHNEYEDLLKY